MKPLNSLLDLGYAEADPPADIEGLDAGRKIAILASMAFEFKELRFSDVYTEGISKITAKGHQIYASELGCVIKLIATAKYGKRNRSKG